MNITELDQYNLRDAVRFHNRLNPRLWGSDEHLHPEVRQALMAIADDFREFLGIQNLEIKDITISGSNAAYNYTPQSDIDLHLVVDIPEMAEDVYRELFNAKKYQYNNQHNITIGDADVELYVQPADEPHVSQGIYSVAQNQWISVPRRKRARIDDSSVQHKYQDLVSRIDDAISTKNETAISDIIQKIKTMRATGLEENGEFGTENLVFKLLRTNGYIQKLYDAKNAAHSEELSIEEDGEDTPRRYGFRYPRFDPAVVERYFKVMIPSLNIQNPPELIMHRDPRWSEQNSSFGRYDPDTNTLHLSIVGRHEMDVLRTMAHELTHCRQNELGMLDDDSGETGSPEENQANAMAGQIMRHVGRNNPGHFRIEPTLGTPSREPEEEEVYEADSNRSHEYYDQLAQKYAQEHGVPLSMVRHVMNRETGHISDPTKRAQAQSKRGAQGIMQLKPITQREVGVTDPNDPEQNIRGGVQYLGKQLQRFKDPVLAMAAYNAGPANVEKYGGVPPFKQTQGYVQGYQPDPVKNMPEPAAPGVLDTVKKTGYEWLRGAGDWINRATAPANLDPNTMKPLKEKRLVPYRGGAPVDDPEINPLRDRLNRGEHPAAIEKDIRRGAGQDAQRLEKEISTQKDLQRQLEQEKAELEKKLRQLKSQPKKEPEKERDIRDRIVDLVNQITAPPRPFPGAFGADDVQREDSEAEKKPEPSIQGGLNLLKQLHGLSRITRGGVEDEVSQEFKNWVRRQGGATDQPTRLPLPDINRNTTNESSGYIPTEKEKNDSRFKMALTVDIKPGETGRQANRMALQTDSQGRPALLRASGKK